METFKNLLEGNLFENSCDLVDSVQYDQSEFGPSETCSENCPHRSDGCPVHTDGCPVHTDGCPVHTDGCPVHTDGCPVHSDGCNP